MYPDYLPIVDITPNVTTVTTASIYLASKDLAGAEDVNVLPQQTV